MRHRMSATNLLELCREFPWRFQRDRCVTRGDMWICRFMMKRSFWWIAALNSFGSMPSTPAATYSAVFYISMSRICRLNIGEETPYYSKLLQLNNTTWIPIGCTSLTGCEKKKKDCVDFSRKRKCKLNTTWINDRRQFHHVLIKFKQDFVKWPCGRKIARKEADKCVLVRKNWRWDDLCILNKNF